MSQPESNSHSSLARSGVAVIASMGVLVGLLFLIMGIVIGVKLDSQLSTLARLSIYFHVLSYALLACFSVCGIHGVATKSRKSVSLFCYMLATQFLTGFASGVICLYLLFRYQAAWIAQTCVLSVRDQFTKTLCRRSHAWKGLTVTIFVCVWAVEIYGVMVAHTYASQLKEEEAERKAPKPPSGAGDPYWRA